MKQQESTEKDQEIKRLETENRTLRETNADLRAQIQMLRERYGINQNKLADPLNLNYRTEPTRKF